MKNILDPKIDNVKDVLTLRKKNLQLLQEGKGTQEVLDILRETRDYLKQYDYKKYGNIVNTSNVLRTA